MSDGHFAERTVAHVVEQYVTSRKTPHRPVSTAHAVRAIRAALPALRISDRELIDLVAAVAIDKGHSVSFDGDGEPRRF